MYLKKQQNNHNFFFKFCLPSYPILFSSLIKAEEKLEIHIQVHHIRMDITIAKMYHCNGPTICACLVGYGIFAIQTKTTYFLKGVLYNIKIINLNYSSQ